MFNVITGIFVFVVVVVFFFIEGKMLRYITYHANLLYKLCNVHVTISRVYCMATRPSFG